MDWAKAFDSVAPGALLQALGRFGLPRPMLAAIEAIYSNRRFSVREAGATSGARPQRAGICQGCPLSPFLFAMVMTVLISDARAAIGQRAAEVEQLIYADDTLILAASADRAAAYNRQ